MSDIHEFTWYDLKHKLDLVCGKTLGEVDKNGVFERLQAYTKVTGIAGNVIEQSVLEYPQDSDQRPDLSVDNEPVELKTTGLRRVTRNKKEVLEAKEPASITAVSIDTIVREDNFQDSLFWHKARVILFVFYLYDAKKTVPAAFYRDFPIMGYYMHRFKPKAVIILEQDWTAVRDFLRKIQSDYPDDEGRKQRYPLLSTVLNKELVYLETVPKYPHPPRFRLRKRIVTLIVEERFGERLDALPGEYTRYSDVDKKCREIETQYKGASIADILRSFRIKVQDDEMVDICKKQYGEQATVLMFGGGTQKMSKIELFQEFGYIGHTVAITSTNKRTEDMKLCAVDFDELLETKVYDEESGDLREKEFEDSDLYRYFHDNKLLCVIFRESTKPSKDNRVRLADNIFVGFRIIDLSDTEIMDAARKAWDAARHTILSGNLKDCPELDKHGNPRYTPKTHLLMSAPNLPKAEDGVVFFRGTGTDANDKPITIDGVRMYRQNYWIKGTFIIERLGL